MMMYEICAQTDQGRRRENNEDAVAFDAQTGLCLLADGMGGYNAGEIASRMAVTFIEPGAGRAGCCGLGRQASGRELRRKWKSASTMSTTHFQCRRFQP